MEGGYVLVRKLQWTWVIARYYLLSKIVGPCLFAYMLHLASGQQGTWGQGGTMNPPPLPEDFGSTLPTSFGHCSLSPPYLPLKFLNLIICPLLLLVLRFIQSIYSVTEQNTLVGKLHKLLAALFIDDDFRKDKCHKLYMYYIYFLPRCGYFNWYLYLKFEFKLF